jgi:hypothetical protein
MNQDDVNEWVQAQLELAPPMTPALSDKVSRLLFGGDRA